MTDKDLDIGYVIQTTFSVIGKRFTELALLAVIFIAVPQIVLSLLMSSMFTEAVATGSVMPSFSIGLFIGVIVAALLPILMQAAVVYTTVEAMIDRPSDVGTSMGVAIGVFLPLFGLSILMGIGLGIGFLLFVVPGLILLTYWAVAVPAFAIEDTGITGAFERSAELTRGQRWRIFGLLVIVWIAYFFGALIVGLLSIGVTGVPSDTATFSFSGIIVDTILAMASAIVSAVGVAVLYVHVRDLKDGTSPDRISDVFS